ncbi:N,O-diacetylmuramidase [Xylariales sp. AK1849]|nr:N,O-diacetylmuramidase [Xylariales sp. AK1849]
MISNTIKLAILIGIALFGIAQAQVQGFDISHYQSTVNFQAAYNSGAQFVIIKATEGTSSIDPMFSSHYKGATKTGFIRGGYHFANPSSASGSAAQQAAFFLAHGGGWTSDGLTLPGMLDLETADSGECYRLSASAMVAWIKEFSDTYHSKTKRYPMLYFSPSWWRNCTENSDVFSQTNPLVLAQYSSNIGNIPGGWSSQTIWQYANAYTYGGDADMFNGDPNGLAKLAKG